MFNTALFALYWAKKLPFIHEHYREIDRENIALRANIADDNKANMATRFRSLAHGYCPG